MISLKTAPVFSFCCFLLLASSSPRSAAEPVPNPEIAGSSNPGNSLSKEEEFNYTQALKDFKYGTNGPSNWFHIFKTCAGKHQSPINIDTVVSGRVHQPHLFWWNYHLKPDSMTVTNNGHTVVLSGHWPQGHNPYFWYSTGGGGEINMALDSIHFHWGTEDTHGSEHLINNVAYPLEMHAVHYDRQFSGLDQALKLNTGIYVVSVFFMISDTHNPNLDGLVGALPNLVNPSSVSVPPLEIGRLIPRFSKGYVTYNGSLTTPPCAEAVTWIIRLTPSTISSQQMSELRKLRNHDGGLLAGNFRPIQQINGRNVRHVM